MHPKLPMNIKHLFFIATILCYQLSDAQQDIVWANKLLEITDRFQFENNGAEAILGVPSVYPGRIEETKADPYSEGYILYNENTLKKNIIKVGFPSATFSRQVLVGGVFNIGAIASITIVTEDGKEKEIYKPDSRASKTKFNTFSAFFAPAKVIAVRIAIDHSKINDWNLLKGVGLSNSEQPIDMRPYILVPQDGFGKKEKLADNISSKDCYEFNPRVSPDGKTLYFVKECPNENNQDIWFSELNENGEWSKAQNAGFPLNNKGHNFVASISIDGRFLILGNTYNDDGSEAGDGVSISHKKEDGTWETPKPIKIPGFKNTNAHANFFMSSDESVLLMALQDEKSYGDLDLYASQYNKYSQTWSTPVNLGATINTPYQEDYPFLAADGKTLYFSSKGYLGYGGHDIFMSKRIDDTWTKWTKPVNLGPLVNSKTDDKGFSMAARGDQAYFNSVNFDVDTVHHMDIYRIDLPKILKQNPQVLMSGTLFDKETKQPIRGTVRVKNTSGELVSYCVSNPRNGKYTLSVPFGKTYQLRIDAINYFKNEETLSLTDSLKGIEFYRNFALSSYLDSGQVITISNLLFEKNSAVLSSTTGAVLDTLAEKLLQQPDAKIEIGGHTDNAGEQTATASKNNTKQKSKKTSAAPVVDNKKLSQDRAQAVADYLVQKGVKADRIICKGYGSQKPVADNNTPEGKAKNRRVVITYLSKLPRD